MSIFTAELDAIVFALRSIKITAKNNINLLFLVTLNLHSGPVVQVGSSHSSNYCETSIHTTVNLCWLPNHMGISGNERADSAAKAALQKDVYDCLISYTDAYQYISQYVRDL